MTKILLFALGTLAVILILKEIKKEYALYVSLTAGMMIIAGTLTELIPAIGYLTEISSLHGIGTEIKTVLKAVSVGAASSFVCEICRDAGEQSLGNKAALFSKAVLLSLSLPLIKELCDTALSALT